MYISTVYFYTVEIIPTQINDYSNTILMHIIIFFHCYIIGIRF